MEDAGSTKEASRNDGPNVLSDSCKTFFTEMNLAPTVGAEENEPHPISPSKSEPPQRKEVPFNHTAENSPARPGTEPRNRASGLFSMVNNSRSESPVRTSRKHIFKTPPHMRNLRNRDLGSGTPPTPTLPNEDGFLGSSPTPGSRGQHAEVLLSATRNAHIGMDPPSSPPDIGPSSPNTHNQHEPFKFSDMSSPHIETRETDSVTRKAAPGHSTGPVSTPVSNRKIDHDKGSSKQNSTKLSRRSVERPRSASGRFIKSPANTQEPDSSPIKGPRKQNRDQNSKTEPEIMASASNRATRNNRRSKRGSEIPAEAVSDGNSSGDDMETQIASQLEQDLELAVDQNERHETDETELPNTFPMTKTRKRKLESDEAHKEPPKEKRRSSRRTSTKSTTLETQTVSPMRTRRSTISRSTQESTVDPSATEPAPKKRKRGSKGSPGNADTGTDQAKDADTSKQQDDSQNTEGNADKNVEDAGPAPKRRKSSRLSGQDIAEHDPSQEKLPEKLPEKPPRSRASRKTKSKGNKSQTPTSQETSVETPTQESSKAASQQGEESSEPQIQMQEPETSADQPTTGQRQGQDQAEGRVASQETRPELDGSDPTVLRSLRGILDEMKLTTLNMDNLKEMDNLLFEIRVQAHEALRRNSG